MAKMQRDGLLADKEWEAEPQAREAGNTHYEEEKKQREYQQVEREADDDMDEDRHQYMAVHVL